MSAWTEAAWIVQQINSRFDFSKIVNDYTAAITDIAIDIQDAYSQIISEKEIEVVNTLPSTPPSNRDGVIFLIAH